MRGELLKAAEWLEAQPLSDAHLLRLIVDSLPDMVFVKDAENLRFVLINPAGEDLLGIPGPELLGKSDYDFFPAAEADFFVAKDREVLDSGRPLEIPEEPIQTRQGLRTLHTAKIGLTSPTGSRYLLGISRDITERKHAQERLHEVMQAARVLVWEVDPECRFTYLSGRLQELLGYSEAELLGRPAYELAACDDGKVERRWKERIVPGKLSFTEVEQQVRTGDERLIWLQVSGVPMIDKNGSLFGYRGAAMDISDRKQRELEQTRTRQALEQAIERAAEASQAKDIFLATVSHELRTPLNGVLGMAGLLLSTDLSETQRDYLQTMQASADTLIAIINDILDYSKMEAGRVELNPEWFCVRTLATRALDLLRPLALQKGLTVRLDLAAGAPASALADQTRIAQVLTNLIGNAIKFTPSGLVELTVTGSPTQLEFAVRDTGIGIDAGQLHHLFRPFSQLDASSTRQYGGTGLGLAISRRLVELLGGSIDLESEPGKGSVFRFNVPLAGSASEAFQEARPGLDDETSPALSVLVAEDNPTNQKVTSLMLSRLGHSCRVVSNGREAIRAFGEQGYHVVLMDLQMPELDGYEAARQILRDCPGAYIVALTAAASGEDRRLARQSGMRDFLAKPVKLDHLRQALLRASRQVFPTS